MTGLMKTSSSKCLPLFFESQMPLNKRVMLTFSVACATALYEKTLFFSSEHCVPVFYKKYLHYSVNYVSNSVNLFYITTEFNLFRVYPNVKIRKSCIIQSSFLGRMKVLYNRADFIAEYQMHAIETILWI